MPAAQLITNFSLSSELFSTPRLIRHHSCCNHCTMMPGVDNISIKIMFFKTKMSRYGCIYKANEKGALGFKAHEMLIIYKRQSKRGD